jgi:hypothetical protein
VFNTSEDLTRYDYGGFPVDRQSGRSYTEFWTQWTVGMAEYSDMPMERPPEEDCQSDCFKAKYTTQYLEKYVDQMQHSGRPLREKIQFGIQVRLIEKVNDKWELSCIDSRDSPVMFSTVKLMIANGENSCQGRNSSKEQSFIRRTLGNPTSSPLKQASTLQ